MEHLRQLVAAARIESWNETIAEIAIRPTLWFTTLGQVRRWVPKRWWAEAPYLPVPAMEYVSFRITTMLGSGDRCLSSTEIVNFLCWCRAYDLRLKAERIAYG